MGAICVLQTAAGQSEDQNVMVSASRGRTRQRGQRGVVATLPRVSLLRQPTPRTVEHFALVVDSLQLDRCDPVRVGRVPIPTPLPRLACGRSYYRFADVS